MVILHVSGVTFDMASNQKCRSMSSAQNPGGSRQWAWDDTLAGGRLNRVGRFVHGKMQSAAHAEWVRHLSGLLSQARRELTAAPLVRTHGSQRQVH